MTQFYPKNLFNILLPLVIVSAPFTVASQQKLPGQSIHLIGGYSRHGSGDYNGIVFGAEYERYVNKRLSLIYSLRGTINDGKTPIYVTNTITGQITDASIRFTTAGVQLGVSGGYSIFRNKTHGLSIALGAFARYQSASNGDDGYSLYYPAATGQPTVLVGYDNRTEQETLAVGAVLQLRYHIMLGKKFSIGLNLGVQTDTHGDVIPQVSLSIARWF